MLVHGAGAVRPAAFWIVFAIAAVIFVLDAMATIAVVEMRPIAVEQNPIARWALGLHPVAPYVLKTAIVGECVVIAAVLRAMGERWAAGAVAAMMALTGLLGIASAVGAAGA